jgi:hypothetical protein
MNTWERDERSEEGARRVHGAGTPIFVWPWTRRSTIGSLVDPEPQHFAEFESTPLVCGADFESLLNLKRKRNCPLK